jgi:hypothetical protein
MKTHKTETTERRRPGDMLDQRYGAIGISAVAAAVRYQSDAKDVPPADAPRKDKKAAA